MTVLREEDGELARFNRDVGLGLGVAILRDVLLCIVFEIRQILQRCITECLSTRDGDLDVDHLDMSFKEGGILGTLLSYLKVQKRVFVLNGVLARLQCLEVMALQKVHYISKQRVQSPPASTSLS